MSKAAELAKIGEVATNSQIGGRRNLVINGAMQISQRATSATGVGATNEAYPTLDRFNFTTTSAGRFTMTQTADGPTGFANCMKLECTTVDTAISASEALILQTKFEGQDVQQLMYGSSSAQPITVSFYVKGNASATYTLEWRNEEDGRNTGKTFNVTTDWTRVSITFTGDTAGAAVDDDSTHAFTLGIWLHGGTTFSGGTFVENTWHATNNIRIGDSQTSFFDSTNRTFFLTGLQIELGNQATPFEHRSFGEEENLCKRYFIKHKAAAPYERFALGTNVTTDDAAFLFKFYPAMRGIPTLTIGTLSHLCVTDADGSNEAIGTAPVIDTAADSTLGVIVYCADIAGDTLTAGEASYLAAADNVNAFLAFDSEL